jgi:tetratricopeptide (TPR) repeat protein
MPEWKKGVLDISPEAVPILEKLLKYLPYSGKMTQLIITSRYTFSLTFDGKDLISERLEPIGLNSFRDADERKKVAELNNIASYPNHRIKHQLIETGRGNPRLMEALNVLVGEIEDVTSLLSAAKGKQDEFVQELVLRQLLESQPEAFQTLLRRSAVYRLPVLKDGIGFVSEGLTDWESAAEKAVRFSLMEKDSTRNVRYWVSPLIREAIFAELQAEERRQSHQAAVSYYQAVLSDSRYDPVSSAELIEHALKAGWGDIAIEEGGGRFLPYLRKTLAYKEALALGKSTLSQIYEPERDDKYGKFISELGLIHYYVGGYKKALEYLEQAFSINIEVHGNIHPSVAAILNQIGLAWNELGEHKKAIRHFEQALCICKEVYGEKHPLVATIRNNIGLAWNDLREHKKAIGHLEQALCIYKEVYGERHAGIATTVNNIGLAWAGLGEYKKAIGYYKQALSINKKVYGEKHPTVARDLNNTGLAWNELGEHKKAIGYYKQALSINKEVYGERHPVVATNLNNIGLAWAGLGEHKKALGYYEQALSINKEVYGERHPVVATDLNNIGEVWRERGESKKALGYYEQALAIDKKVYGNRHPMVAGNLNNIGLAWHALDEPKKALGYYEQALAIDKEVYGNRHPTVARNLTNIGSAWYNLGNSQRAKEYFLQAYSLSREFYGDEHPLTRTVKKGLEILSAN